MITLVGITRHQMGGIMVFSRAVCISLTVTLVLCLSGSPGVAFEARNKLGGMRDPQDGERIIGAVKSTVEGASYKDSIVSMSVEDVWPPYKVMVDFVLRDRLSKSNLEDLSNAVRHGAGSGFERYFVGFYVEGSSSGYWASAHQDPTTDIKIYGLGAVEWDALVSKAKSYEPSRGETVVAHTIISGSLAHQLLIVKNGKKYLERRIFSGSNDAQDEPLLKKGGRYWRVDSDFGENYKINRGKLEIHDRDGIISSHSLVNE